MSADTSADETAMSLFFTRSHDIVMIGQWPGQRSSSVAGARVKKNWLHLSYFRQSLCSVQNIADADQATSAPIKVKESLGRECTLQDLKVAVKNLHEGFDLTTYASLLRECAIFRSLSDGKRVHAQILKSEYCQNGYLGNLVLQMYGKCGSVEEAKEVFDKLQERNIFSWTIMITAQGQNGYLDEALKTFGRMQLEGVEPNEVTFINIFNACAAAADCSHGTKMHSLIADTEAEQDITVATSIVNMYGKCGKIEDARLMFDKMQYRDPITWNAMIANYVQNGCGWEALKVFWYMLFEGQMPNKATCATLVDACGTLNDLQRGKLMHAFILDGGFEVDDILGNCLLHMYGKCGSIEDARLVFDEMPLKSVISWNSMVAVYARKRLGAEAIGLLLRMWMEGLDIDKVTFLSIVDACANMEDLNQGKLIHSRILAGGLESDVYLGTALVTMYGKCGRISDARNSFDRIRLRDLISWNAMLAAYVQNGHSRDAVNILHNMDLEGVKPNKITLTSILDACSLNQGNAIHLRIVESGIESDLLAGTALINMYAKCRSFGNAKAVFDNMPKKDIQAWTAMIASSVENELGYEALLLFWTMDLEGIPANKVTLVSVIDACTLLSALSQGRSIHQRISTSGFDTDIVVGNSLVNMYSKCGKPDDARRIFDNMSNRDAISWNAMIIGCAQNDLGKDAIELYWKMSYEGMKADMVTFIGILDACASSESLTACKLIHAQAVEGGFDSINVVGTTLINIYGKCGCIWDAECVFQKLDKRDVVSWNAMVVAYSQDNSKRALRLMREMDAEGVKQDRVTFMGIIDAAANLANLQQSKLVEIRTSAAGYATDLMVGNTLVSMYGKCGSLDDAKASFKRMRERNVVTWNALIVAYTQNGHVADAFEVFCEMDLEGMKPNHVSFISILFACNHSGLLDESLRYFSYMTQDHSLEAAPEHYTSLISVLGRAGYLEQAENLLNSMPREVTAMEWTTFLGGCSLHSNAERGERAAARISKLEPNSAAPYVTLSNMMRLRD